jgi:16S rRNA (cytosine967-C5)-methyltransferase
MAKRKAGHSAAFVNALLRKLCDEAESGLPEVEGEDEIVRLSVTYSHPTWLVQRFSDMLGLAETEALLRENNAQTPIYAAVNTLRTDAQALISRIESDGARAEPNSEPGMLELSATGDIARLPSFARGEFFVQDPAALRAARLCGASSGDTVIDVCAAPGGKSFALALDMKDKGKIHAFDREARVPAIREGAARLGITCVEARAWDASAVFSELEGSADIVLCDVPCSGLGVIRKKPEIRYKTREEIAGMPEIQRGILRAARKYVKPGGTLVYSTCTLLPEENGEIISRFLSENPDFSLDFEETLYPHRDGTDGFYMARMRR